VALFLQIPQAPGGAREAREFISDRIYDSLIVMFQYTKVNSISIIFMSKNSISIFLEPCNATWLF
jgi:hypothetical protein